MYLLRKYETIRLEKILVVGLVVTKQTAYLPTYLPASQMSLFDCGLAGGHDSRQDITAPSMPSDESRNKRGGRKKNCKRRSLLFRNLLG